MHQAIPLLADGDATRRQRQLERRPQAPQRLDWHPMSMPRTMWSQYGTGLVHGATVVGEAMREQSERRQWSLWHGQGDQALGTMDDRENAIASFAGTEARDAGLVQALSEWRPYSVHNRPVLPQYGERYRHGEPMATGGVESTVNAVGSQRFGKQPPMPWSKEGAHGLLQPRVRTLNGALAGLCQRWYPELDMQAEELPMAA
jgi:hypothetical protein